MKAVARGKFAAIYEKRKISNPQPYLQLKQLEKEEQTKSNDISHRRKEIRVRLEITKRENRKTIQKINKTKSWFLEEINKILDKPLAKLVKANKKRRFRGSLGGSVVWHLP